jgi:hypothetical protein
MVYGENQHVFQLWTGVTYYIALRTKNFILAVVFSGLLFLSFMCSWI